MDETEVKVNDGGEVDDAISGPKAEDEVVGVEVARGR